MTCTAPFGFSEVFKVLNAGELNHRITIEMNEPIKSSDGSPLENWVTVVSVWADYQAKSGREFFAAQRLRRTGPSLSRGGLS